MVWKTVYFTQESKTSADRQCVGQSLFGFSLSQGKKISENASQMEHTHIYGSHIHARGANDRKRERGREQETPFSLLLYTNY